MKKYTITLTDAENKALGAVAFDQNEWIQTVVHERCRIAIDEIVQIEVQRLLSEGKSITGSKDEIVISSNIESAKDRQSRLDDEFKKSLEQQG